MAVKNRPVRPQDGRSNPFLQEKLKKYITDPVFLLGNGKSRERFNLEELRSIGTIFGCNAIYRDFTPDILLAIDAKLLNEIRASDYDCNENVCIVPSSRAVAIPGSYKWKSERFNTTGCFGMHMISRCIKPKKCYMLGMDGYPGNVYDSTLNYQPNTLKNFSGVTSYYLKALKASPDTIFVNVNDKDAWPNECLQTGKYEFMTFEEFEKTVML